MNKPPKPPLSTSTPCLSIRAENPACPGSPEPLSHFLKSLPQPISEWSIITSVELGISIESRETLRKWRVCSEIITRAAVSHQQYKEPGEVHTCFGDPPCLICWCLIAVNVILMIGKLWVWHCLWHLSYLLSFWGCCEVLRCSRWGRPSPGLAGSRMQ